MYIYLSSAEKLTTTLNFETCDFEVDTQKLVKT